MDATSAIAGSTKYAASTTTAMPASQPLKSGAKRKLNVRDEDDQPATVDKLGKQDLQTNARDSEKRMSENISRPTLDAANKVIEAKGPEAAVLRKDGRNGKDKASGASTTVAATGRKALGPSKFYDNSKLGDD